MTRSRSGISPSGVWSEPSRSNQSVPLVTLIDQSMALRVGRFSNSTAKPRRAAAARKAGMFWVGKRQIAAIVPLAARKASEPARSISRSSRGCPRGTVRSGWSIDSMMRWVRASRSTRMSFSVGWV